MVEKLLRATGYYSWAIRPAAGVTTGYGIVLTFLRWGSPYECAGDLTIFPESTAPEKIQLSWFRFFFSPAEETRIAILRENKPQRHYRSEQGAGTDLQTKVIVSKFVTC